MGDGSSKIMYLTPKNSSTSKVRFSITDGTTTQFIDGAAALGTGWTHVVVTFSGNTGTLYVNGSQAGQNTSMTLDPDAVNAAYMQNCNYSAETPRATTSRAASTTSEPTTRL